MTLVLACGGSDTGGADCGAVMCAQDLCAGVTCGSGQVCAPNTGLCVACSDQGAGCPAGPCSVNNGGCDPLTQCTSGSNNMPLCGDCPTGYVGTGASGCVVDEPDQPDLTVAVDLITFTEQGVQVDFTVTNAGAASTGATVRGRFIDQAPQAPAVDDTGGTDFDVAVPALEANASESFRSILPWTTTDQTGQAWLIVDSAATLDESDEANNVSPGFAWGLPDLRVELTSIALAGGSNVRAYYDVINDGLSPVSGSLRVAFWQDLAFPPSPANTATSTQFLTLNAPLPGLGGRAAHDLAFSVTLGGGRGYVRVNSNELVPEFTTSNNTSGAVFWGTGDRPDLRVSIQSVTPTTGPSATIAFTVHNDGPQPASPSTFYVRALNAASPPSAAAFGGNHLVATVGTIPPGGSVATSVVASIFAAASGTLYLLADTSPSSSNGNVSESNEFNNVSPGFMWGTNVPRPDLTVMLDSISDLGNGTATVTYTLRNMGMASVDGGSVSIDFYENLMTAPTGSTPSQATFGAPGGTIAAGGQVSGAATVPIGCRIARSFLYVDRSSQIAESNEANNASIGVNRTPPAPSPDLRVSVQQIDVDGNGNASRVYYRVDNIGAGVSDGCQLALYLYPNASTAPGPGDATEHIVATPTTPIPPAGSRSGSFPVSGLPAGTFYVIVNREGRIPETTLGNNTSAATSW
ncbi:MAG: hypothetical protein KC593_10810 [Myxococcales bacterium]|nr:hypothetical protein [Myxococcales bacterium]MCB9626281.1 hypothetical protein [Sandaracinaceae bacterium]